MLPVRFNLLLPMTGLTLFGLVLTDAAQGQGPAFDRQIAPILAEHCLSCHSGAEPKGGLDLSQHAQALAGGNKGVDLVPGKPGASLLWEYVAKNKMPPKKPLSASEKALLEQWIVAGAKWGADPIDPFRFTTSKRAGVDWWALQPVTRPTIPTAPTGASATNPIDAFLHKELHARGLHFNPPADRRALIRRLSIDLLGLPPAPAEVEAFVRDTSPNAFENVVDRYLASPRYGIAWARHWLDIVRFGESNGFEHDEFRPNAWPYRDWVVDALNRDMPYDEFARLQLAGDILRPGDAAALAATGFLVAGSYDSVGQTQQSAAMRKVVRQDELEDIVGTVGQTFLGLTVQCARCHDHKFDPVRQLEYYRLAAALSGVHQGERELPIPPAEAVAQRAALDRLLLEQKAIEEPAQREFRASRGVAPIVTVRPLFRWDFSRGLRDQESGLELRLQGAVRLASGELALDGRTAFAISGPISRDLKAKTLEAWVSLAGLQQQGGGVVSIQTRGGGAFDAIVFGEQEPRRWMAGSDNFKRTQSFHGPAEDAGKDTVIHIAVVYADNGNITAYRNGQPYGSLYHADGPVSFRAGEAQVLIGLRHAPAGGNRLLAGTVRVVQIYDRALNAAEIAASAQSGSDYLSTDALLEHLTPQATARWRTLRGQIANLQMSLQAGARRVHAVAPRDPEEMYVLASGNPASPGRRATPGAVAAVAGPSADFGPGKERFESVCRRRLADWITSPRNALFARVMVNRLWHYHFGAGLVDTPNDFGFNGARPSHPQLLDWLAAEMVRDGWSLKKLHRLIVTSAAYRQSSAANELAARIDADNRLLWRMSPRRLEAETFRDAVLAISGELNERMGGPGFQEFNLKQAPGTITNSYLAADPSGEEFNRRTLYRAWARGGRNKLLDTLDCPDPSTTAPRRAVTTTPLQALALMNNIFVLRQARQFADRLRREAGADRNAQIRLAYELAFGRRATNEELAQIRRGLNAANLEVLTRALLNCNEFLYID
jgi:hypothetical protein